MSQKISSLSADGATCAQTDALNNSAASPSPIIRPQWPPPGIKPYYADDSCVIVLGDCRDILPHVSADVVVTDPPYNYGKEYGSHNDSMTDADFWEWLETRFTLTADALRDGGSVYFTCSTQMMARCESWGFLRFRQWLIWHRPNLINVHAHSDWKQTWEPIYYGGKGKFSARKGVFPDSAVFTVAAPQSNFRDGRDHVCQRPLALVRAWLNRADGDLVLDPFMGSGTTLVAAKQLGRRAIGIEIEERYVEIAIRRLRQEVLPFEREEQRAPVQASLLETIQDDSAFLSAETVRLVRGDVPEGFK